ncbi:hypothetical protein C8J57DRAFT_1235020 [Mycena rebaudengoi]|nr:hypothetical protein C8J57DRAFT_1516735 [Mycena rebaudengoi]KAJ7257296.1 hypothetical protein C8J57DRAFT_1235020 [Mycena rebaudengoi]
MDTAVVEAMVSSFSIVDIKYLQSLVLVWTPMYALLKASVQTLQKIRIAYPNDTPFDLDVLEGNQTLCSIEVVAFDTHLASSIQLFAPLSHLQALKTISFHLTSELNSYWVEWTKLDAILARAGDELKDVYFTAYSDAGAAADLERVKQQLPSIAGKTSHKNEVFSQDYTFGPHM